MLTDSAVRTTAGYTRKQRPWETGVLKDPKDKWDSRSSGAEQWDGVRLYQGTGVCVSVFSSLLER